MVETDTRKQTHTHTRCIVYHQALLVFAAQDVQTAIIGVREETGPVKTTTTILLPLLAPMLYEIRHQCFRKGQTI